MKKGARVLANGEPGCITKMQENRLNDIDYVYNIEVKLDKLKHSNPYHPNDVIEAMTVEASLQA